MNAKLTLFFILLTLQVSYCKINNRDNITSLNLDELYYEPSCYKADNENFLFFKVENITNIHKTGKMLIKYGPSGFSQVYDKVSIYNSSLMTPDNLIEEITGLYGYYEFDLNKTSELDTIFISYEQSTQFQEYENYICFDYMTSKGKEITFYEKNTDQNKYNDFNQQSFTFFIDTSKVENNQEVEILFPKKEGETGLIIQEGNIELKDDSDKTIEGFYLQFNNDLKHIQFYSNKTKSYILIKINVYTDNYFHNGTFTLMRTIANYINGNEIYKITIDKAMMDKFMDIPLAYYFPAYSLTDKQLVYRTDLNESGIPSTFLWYNNFSYIYEYSQNLLVLDSSTLESYDKKEGTENPMFSIILYGNITDKEKTYLLLIELIKNEDMKYYDYSPKINYMFSNEVFNKTTCQVYNTKESGINGYIFKTINIIGNSKLYYTNTTITNDEFLKEFTLIPNNYIYKENEPNLVFKTDKGSENINYYSSVLYYRKSGEIQITGEGEDFVNNFLNLYKKKGDDLKLSYKLPEKNYFLMKLPNDLSGAFGEEIGIQYTLNGKNFTLNLTKDNPIITIEHEGIDEISFDIIAEEDILLETVYMQKPYLEMVTFLNTSSTEFIEPKVTRGMSVVVFTLDKSNTNDKTLVVELNTTEASAFVLTTTLKYYGNCKYFSIEENMYQEAYIMEKKLIVHEFINDYSEKNSLYTKDEVCIISFIYQDTKINDEFQPVPVRIYYKNSEITSTESEESKSTESEESKSTESEESKSTESEESKSTESGESSENPPEGNSGGLQGYEIALIVIACIILVVGILIAIYLLRKSKRNKGAQEVLSSELEKVDEGLMLK